MHGKLLTRCLVVALGLVLAAPASSGGPTDFAATVAATRSVLSIDHGRAGGAAAGTLLARARDAHFVLVGEEHGVATIAEAVRAIALLLQPAGYRHFALEADPWTAGILERELRAGGLRGLARWLGTGDHRLAIPFYSWSAEAELAETFTHGDNYPALWGLDQVFIGAYGTLLADVAQRASSADARRQAAMLAGQARGNLDFLATVDEQALPRLRAALEAPPDRELAALLDAMIESAHIYAPFISRPGLSVYAANLAREDLMKRNFLASYRAAGEPKVLLKFGSNHMVRGLSPTRVPSLGSFVSDLALHDGTGTFSVLVLCGPGTVAGDFHGATGSCEIDLRKEAPELAAQLDATNPVLFDLGPWKDVPQRWQHLDTGLRALLWGYDALLVVPNGEPARMLRAE